MKIVRFDSEAGPSFGALQNDGSARVLAGNLYTGLRETGETVRPTRWLAPVEPTVIAGIGLNYRRHAEESGAKLPQFPIVFYKNLASVIGPGAPIVLPRTLRSDKVDYECELAVVIGKAARNVSRENALDYVLGYTAANDVSARDWQLEWGGRQWCRGKSFDTFCPIGPTLVTPDEISDPGALRIRTILNGETVQDWTTSDMIFDVPALIEFLSGSTTLLPGTVILTGTPHGVGMARTPPLWLRGGDTVTVAIDGIGDLTNPVVEES